MNDWLSGAANSYVPTINRESEFIMHFTGTPNSLQNFLVNFL